MHILSVKKYPDGNEACNSENLKKMIFMISVGISELIITIHHLASTIHY